MSLPEILLWQRLKGSPGDVAFRKQHPINNYRADFYCATAKLVIEVDGAAHDMGDRPERDVNRTKWLEQKGYCIMRIRAADVLRDADEAAHSIVSFATGIIKENPPRLRGGGGAADGRGGVQPSEFEGDDAPLHRASAVPLPVNGEALS